MKFFTGLLFAFICISLNVSAVDVVIDTARHYSINNTQYISLKSEQTGQAHELIVSLPASYGQEPNKKYPVLYFLDAYWDQPMVSATYGNLLYDKVAPEFIMVGFSYPEGANYGEERLRDFTPTREVERKTTSGAAGAFLAFMKETVVPIVEANYRVDPTQRALSGSSLGGLFTIYAMYQEPEFFDRYIAISPAVIWDDEYLFKLDATYASKHKGLNARLFISYGTAEYQPFSQPIAKFQQQIQQRNYQGLALQNYQMQGLRHTAVKGEGYAHGLIWAWKDITPEVASGLELEMKASKN